MVAEPRIDRSGLCRQWGQQLPSTEFGSRQQSAAVPVTRGTASRIAVAHAKVAFPRNVNAHSSDTLNGSVYAAHINCLSAAIPHPTGHRTLRATALGHETATMNAGPTFR